MRAGMAAQGGLQGLLPGGASAAGGTSGAASSTDGNGRSAGEDASADATTSRFASSAGGLLSALGPVGQAAATGVGLAGSLGARAAAVGADLSNQMGVGHGNYVPDFSADRDLPGVLAGVEIHDGPPQGPAGRRVAVVQDHTTRTWAVTASVVHPGIGMSEADERARFGTGLSELLDLASRTELVDEILLLVRTVPEDGAERDQWLTRHRNPDGPTVARVVNDELQAALTGASVRTEAFITLVVPESRLGKAAKEAGGGVEGRARVLYSLTAECDAQLRGAVGMTTVEWLTSPQLAAACRTGFAPGDRAGIIDALTAHTTDPSSERGRAVGDGRPLRRRPRRQALQPRRVELDLGHHQAPRQRGGHGRARADPHPDRTGGAALPARRVPDHQRDRGGPAVREQRVGRRHGRRAAHQGQGQTPHPSHG
jgi:hypothetical protein